MERISVLNEQFLSNGSKIKRGIYISTDGKVDKSNPKNKSRYVVGTLDDFSTLLTGDENRKCSQVDLDGDFMLLYDQRSREPRNKFILRYIDNTNIDGPIIIINKKSDLKVTAHKTLGKIALKNINWIGFSLE